MLIILCSFVGTSECSYLRRPLSLTSLGHENNKESNSSDNGQNISRRRRNTLGDLPTERGSKSAYQSTRRRLFSVEYQDGSALTAVLSNSL